MVENSPGFCSVQPLYSHNFYSRSINRSKHSWPAKFSSQCDICAHNCLFDYFLCYDIFYLFFLVLFKVFQSPHEMGWQWIYYKQILKEDGDEEEEKKLAANVKKIKWRNVKNLRIKCTHDVKMCIDRWSRRFFFLHGVDGGNGKPRKNKWNERRAQQFKRNNKRHSFLSFKCKVIISCCWIILVSRIESINMWLVNTNPNTHIPSLQNADSDALNNPNVAVHMLWFKAISKLPILPQQQLRCL